MTKRDPITALIAARTVPAELEPDLRRIARNYREQLARDNERPPSAAVRRALVDFQRHAAAMANWLERANPTDQRSAHREALAMMDVQRRGIGPDVRAWESLLVLMIQRRFEALNAAALTAPRGRHKGAVRAGADQLRQAMEHHGLRVTTGLTDTRGSAAIQALVAIARTAGDRSVTPAAAKKVLSERGTLTRRNSTD